MPGCSGPGLANGSFSQELRAGVLGSGPRGHSLPSVAALLGGVQASVVAFCALRACVCEDSLEATEPPACLGDPSSGCLQRPQGPDSGGAFGIEQSAVKDVFKGFLWSNLNRNGSISGVF